VIKGSKGIIDACLNAIRCIPYWPALHRESSNLLRERSKLADFEVESDYGNA